MNLYILKELFYFCQLFILLKKNCIFLNLFLYFFWLFWNYVYLKIIFIFSSVFSRTQFFFLIFKYLLDTRVCVLSFIFNIFLYLFSFIQKIFSLKKYQNITSDWEKRSGKWNTLLNCYDKKFHIDCFDNKEWQNVWPQEICSVWKKKGFRWRIISLKWKCVSKKWFQYISFLY